MNRENLAKIRDYLASGNLQADFTMSTWSAALDDMTCGTLGCVVGHATLIPGWEKRKGENWDVYSERIFGLSTVEDGGAWDWCFSAEWVNGDNTPLGAAKRIQYLLDKGSAPKEAERTFSWEHEDDYLPIKNLVPLYQDIQL